MTRDELQLRTKQFALRVIKLVEALPNKPVGWELGRQLLRSATSVSANYRAARRARSKKEFAAKIGVVVEEADESVHWIELVMESGLVKEARITALRQEAEALMRIFARTQRTARSANQIAKAPNRQITKSKTATA
jgi:four helix bundle protein